ncbi:MAG: hypothetical protein QOG83_1072, partial [Alphaproteobacteria bacterium]|nr:hypothetical protein [Alphaproteobacteria bacterium]
MLCGVSCALAGSADDEWYDDRFLMFGGFDLWRGGGFAHGGML